MSIHKKVLLGKRELLDIQQKGNDKLREDILGVGAIIDIELEMIAKKLGIAGVEAFKKSITQRVYDAIYFDSKFLATQDKKDSQEIAELISELEQKTQLVRMAQL